MMKTLTVRLPETLIASIEAESRERHMSKSDVIRERLASYDVSARHNAPLAGIVDLIGSVDDLPADLSSLRKNYLKKTGYGQKHRR